MSPSSVLSLLVLAWAPALVHACTDILVTPGASADGSAMVGYNADSVSLYGVLYHYPRTEGRGGQLREIFDWDSGVHLGEIPEVNSTYNVVGNSNEHGLVIGESTFGGVPELDGKKQKEALGAILDYGSLIYITLQRAKTAVEAIHTIDSLLNDYGYVSEGESFSIADKSGDVWIMELISRGDTYGKLGAVWVAQKIPDGYVSAHANQARTTTFPRDDPDNCLFAEDVVDVAVHYGLYAAEEDPLKFSFSDTYNPVQFTSARMSEARVWSMFSAIADSDGEFQKQYQSYAMGTNTKNRMPLFIKPYAKLSLMDITHLMSSHYEGTEMDPSKDSGAGIFASPYRSRPLVWDYNGKHYHNERTLATPRTGWTFIAQLRPWMPAEFAALVWFATDDSSTSPRVPVFGSNWEIAEPYVGKGTQDGVPAPLLKLDMDKAFWVQNMVSNFCYYRWQDAYPVVRQRIDALQSTLIEKVNSLDDELLQIYKDYGAQSAVDHATRFSVRSANDVHHQWFDFYGELFVRFRDLHIITAKEDEPSCGCDAKEPGLSEAVKKRIIDETGNHYEISNKGNTGKLDTQQLFSSVKVQ